MMGSPDSSTCLSMTRRESAQAASLPWSRGWGEGSPPPSHGHDENNHSESVCVLDRELPPGRGSLLPLASAPASSLDSAPHGTTAVEPLVLDASSPGSEGRDALERETERVSLPPRAVKRIVTQGGTGPGPCPVPASCLPSLPWALTSVDPCPSPRVTYCVPFPQQYTVWGPP